MTPRGRRWRRIFLGIGLAAVALWSVTPGVLRVIVRHRLQAMVSDRLNARLDIGRLVYTYPYGVTVTDAALVTQTPGGEPLTLLDIPRLELQLAKLPFGKGPLVIERLEIDAPSIHLIRTANGMVGRKTIIRQSENPQAESGPPVKLSDILRLTRFTMHGAKLVYDDTTAPGTVPVVWRDLNVDLNITPESAGNYAYHLNVNNAPLATLAADGSANIDDLTLRIDQCALAVAVDPDAAQSPLPAVVQRPLHEWQARGQIGINLSADIPLHHPADGVYHCQLDLNGASARVPGWGTPLDKLLLKMEFSHGSQASDSAHLDVLEAESQGAHVRIDDAVATADRVSGAWQTKLANGHVDAPSNLSTLPADVRKDIDRLHLSGSLDFALSASGPSLGRDLTKCAATLVLRPRNLTLRPPGFSEPIGGMGDATLTLANGAVLVQELRAASGDNLLFLRQAKIQLADLPAVLHISDAAGCLTLGPTRTYPPVFAKQLAVAQPVGPFFFNGDVEVNLAQPQSALDYHLTFHTDRGRITLGDSHIPLTAINTIVTLTSAGATIQKLNASLLDGSCGVTGNVQFAQGTPYALKLDCRDLDLKALAGYLAQSGQPPPRLSGQAMLRADLNGVVPPNGAPAYEGLRGTGEFEIRHGDFWEMPVMKSIAGAFSKESLTVGEAAGQFQLGDGKIHFMRAAASSPLLGVEGSGDVTYGGKLDLRGVVDPFGSWGDRAGDQGPLARILGTVQRTINIATSQALYDIAVTGTTSDPQTKPMPAPAVTRGVKSLLSKVRSPNFVGGLLDELHKQTDESAPDPAQTH